MPLKIIATRKLENARTSTSGGRTSESQWTRAAELTNDPSLQTILKRIEGEIERGEYPKAKH